jgi:hypothetical protein
MKTIYLPVLAFILFLGGSAQAAFISHRCLDQFMPAVDDSVPPPAKVFVPAECQYYKVTDLNNDQLKKTNQYFSAHHLTLSLDETLSGVLGAVINSKGVARSRAPVSSASVAPPSGQSLPMNVPKAQISQPVTTTSRADELADGQYRLDFELQVGTSPNEKKQIYLNDRVARTISLKYAKAKIKIVETSEDPQLGGESYMIYVDVFRNDGGDYKAINPEGSGVGLRENFADTLTLKTGVSQNSFVFKFLMSKNAN